MQIVSECQILFYGKIRKNVSICRLLKILPSVLSIKETGHTKLIFHPLTRETTFVTTSCLYSYTHKAPSEKRSALKKKKKKKKNSSHCEQILSF